MTTPPPHEPGNRLDRNGIAHNPIIVGCALGVVSAVLFGSTLSGSALGLLLSYVAPLPIIVAALGWTHLSGLLALAIGGAVLSLALSSHTGIAYAFGIALPAWSLAFGALLARRDPVSNAVVFMPIGALVAAIPAIAATVTIVGALSLSGSYEGYIKIVTEAIEAMLKLQTKSPDGSPLATALAIPGGASTEDVVRIVIAALPFVTGASFSLLFAANLWGGGKAVYLSGRLPRPWTPMPELLLPAGLIGIFGVAVILSTVTGFIGLYGQALAGGAVATLILQGLASLHRITLGKQSRPLILGLTYSAVVLAQIWVLPLIALYGLYRVLTRPNQSGGKPPLQIS